MQFSHLHNHTQFSLLDGASKITKLFEKAKADNMPAMAITDHGNMFGVFEFVAEAAKHKIKPIVGCEFYVVEDHTIKQFTKAQKDVRVHQLLLAKNAEGYKNLTKLCSLGYIEGLYGKYPRVTKAMIEKYKEGLIASTCCIGASVPQAILKHGEKEGEIEFKWWLDMFGEDYYIELQRHDLQDQNIVNAVLLKFAKKYNVKIIASNDSHYIEQNDWEAHDILLCVNTGEKLATPSSKDFNDEGSVGPKNTRFAFPNNQFYFKTTDEMKMLFNDLPEAIDNTNEIVGKVETLDLKKDIMLPNFPIPEEFKLHADDKLNQWEYLKHLSFEGAKKRYGEISPSIEERLNFELFTIKTMGFAGYFLIVMDFIKAGRDLGVMIGPGRGSAAGSVVAYCISITNIDPIKYNLLFERFLNPDRKSMPDIDTDFDDEGRQKVIDYVVEKYGKNQVAQIITYGTMATKSSIKDVARVMDLPLSEANFIAKLIPDKASYGINFDILLKAPITGPKSLTELQMNAEEIENVKKIRGMYSQDDLIGKVLKQAEKLEGTVRNTGIHAAGIIIAPEDLSGIVPVCTTKESDLLITQYEGKVIEDAGVIKMDFLGLRNLSIIKEALRMIYENHGVKIEIDEIPLDDEKTYQLFQKAETTAIFQFESDNMKKYLKELKPDEFNDLIAMCALYRPGPMAYIPNYIARKHGKEAVNYDLPEVEELLSETYGITVYQEQVMLLSQKIGNFTKGDADVLRKAMGKKNPEVLNKMKAKFLEGGAENNHPQEILEKIWVDWEAFAQYAFNKSHSTCYAFVAYQTAYLKAHYPEEYMASVLTSQLGSIDKITFFMEECKLLGLAVLGPDVNESKKRFSVNKNKEIRFGLGGIKGTGDAAVDALIEEREKNGEYKDIYDFIERVNLRTVNKKTIESLVYAGAFDCFKELHRAIYFSESENSNYIEKLIRYANKINEERDSAQNSLFGEMSSGNGFEIQKPKYAMVEPWGDIEKLKYEKEVVGFYISGHPLDQFAIEMSICKPLDKVFSPENIGRHITFGGVIVACQERPTKNGSPSLVFKIEDYQSSLELRIYNKEYLEFKNFLSLGLFVFISGSVIEDSFRESEYKFRISKVELLGDIKEKKFKNVNIKMPIEMVNDDNIDKLEEILIKYPGKYMFNISVNDENENYDVALFSRNLRIDLNLEVQKRLRELVGESNLNFGLN